MAGRQNPQASGLCSPGMRAGIALGANLGDRFSCLTTARERIFALAGVVPPFLSSALYETEPVDCEPGAAKFLNAVIEIGYDGILTPAAGGTAENRSRPRPAAGT